MIVLAVGMPRAGSGWHYNLIHDLLVAAGGQDARALRRRYLLSPLLTEVNCNIGALSARRLLPVLVPSLLGNRFAIKAHAGPSPFAMRLIENGRLRPSYIYRDPRAALLSAYEYGERARAAGRENAFSQLETINAAIDFMLGYLRIWEAWMAVEAAHQLRYEDLLSDYAAEVARLLAFLEIDAAAPPIDAVIEKYRPGQATQGEVGLHFRRGQPERFRRALSSKQIEACNRAFGPYLARMGYAL